MTTAKVSATGTMAGERRVLATPAWWPSTANDRIVTRYSDADCA
jgi:hypothetical protein